MHAWPAADGSPLGLWHCGIMMFRSFHIFLFFLIKWQQEITITNCLFSENEQAHNISRIFLEFYSDWVITHFRRLGGGVKVTRSITGLFDLLTWVPLFQTHERLWRGAGAGGSRLPFQSSIIQTKFTRQCNLWSLHKKINGHKVLA